MANEAQQKPKTSENSPVIANKKPKRRGYSGSIPAFLIALVALIFAFYALYNNFTLRKLYHQQNEIINLALDNLQKETQQRLNTLDATVNQTESAVEKQLQNLRNNLQQAQPMAQQDWLLLKARYYLELAQINGHWSENPQTTIALLQQADASISHVSDQRLLSLRQAIAKEIAQLQALPKHDIVGLLSQLDAAQNTVETLVMKQPLQNTEHELSAPKPSSWRDKLQKSINHLEKLVIIRRNDAAIQPLLSPLQQNILRDSIRLKLQEAQWAILQNNSQVYQLALHNALADIKENFAENAATQALIKQLQGLQQIKLVSPKTIANEALPLLNQLLNLKNSGEAQ